MNSREPDATEPPLPVPRRCRGTSLARHSSPRRRSQEELALLAQPHQIRNCLLLAPGGGVIAKAGTIPDGLAARGWRATPGADGIYWHGPGSIRDFGLAADACLPAVHQPSQLAPSLFPLRWLGVVLRDRPCSSHRRLTRSSGG